MRPSRHTVEIFLLLALLQGVITQHTMRVYEGALGWQNFTAMALLALPGAVGLLAWCLLRRYRLPNAQQWLALLVLEAVRWLILPLTPPSIRAFPWLHEVRWGVPFLLNLAAPLWLALLAALHLVRVEVPRAVAAAGIAAIGAACLIIPVEGYTVQPNQLPVLLLQLVLIVLTVYSWDFARIRLAGLNSLAAAGSSLLLNAVANVAFALLLEHPMTQPIDWRNLALPWAVQLVIFTAATCLWFWLLTRMPLPAFTMNPLANWISVLAADFLVPTLYALRNWRFVLALVIAVAALTVALRARVEEEQPVALGIAQP